MRGAGELLADKGDELVVVGLHFGRVGVECIITINVVAKFFFAAAELFQLSGVVLVTIDGEFKKFNGAGGGIIHAFCVAFGFGSYGARYFAADVAHLEGKWKLRPAASGESGVDEFARRGRSLHIMIVSREAT